MVALGISWPLARYLSRPIQQMRNAIGQLSKRNWSAIDIDQRSDEMGELGKDIQHLSRLLKRYEESQNQWLANTSHELRTPLSILKGEIEANLNRLVNDIHQLNKAQLGAWEWQKVNIKLHAWLKQQSDGH